MSVATIKKLLRIQPTAIMFAQERSVYIKVAAFHDTPAMFVLLGDDPCCSLENGAGWESGVEGWVGWHTDCGCFPRQPLDVLREFASTTNLVPQKIDVYTWALCPKVSTHKITAIHCIKKV